MNKETSLIKIEEFVDANWEDIVADITRLVAIPSVEGEPALGAPFGVEPLHAMHCALDIAEKLGFTVRDDGGYAGIADLHGESDKVIALIGHVDVVPAADGWDTDPFTVIRREGYLLGRGTLDDKGPVVVGLYALKFFAEHYQEIPYTLRMIVGSNEETGLRDVAYYVEHHGSPVFLFTPDAAFPVCYGEKGCYTGNFLSAPMRGGKILKLDCGVASNVIPDKATALVDTAIETLSVADGIDLTQEDGHVRITAHGIGGHASMPQGTVNAIVVLATYLLDSEVLNENEMSFFGFVKTIGTSTDGSAMGIAARDEIFDPLTCIVGMLSIEDDHFKLNTNIRYPRTITNDAITAKLTENVAKIGGTYLPEKNSKPFHVDPDGREIQTLLNAYIDVTGKKDAKPFTIGGGTYAGYFENAASFGPEEPDEPTPDWVGSMHGPNEGISEDLLKRALKIYILALERLLRLEF